MDVDLERRAVDLVDHPHQLRLAAESQRIKEAAFVAKGHAGRLGGQRQFLQNTPGLIPGAFGSAKMDQNGFRAEVRGQLGVFEEQLNSAPPAVQRREVLGITPGPVGRQRRDFNTSFGGRRPDRRALLRKQLVGPDASSLSVAAGLSVGNRAQLDAIVAQGGKLAE